MATPLVIGIDSSTTSCKAIAWDKDGNAVSEGRSAYALDQPRPKWFEQDAEDWWRGTSQAVRILLDSIDDARVEALCITHQRESFVPVDARGQVLRKAILWLDERSQAEVQELARAVGKDRFHRITGKPLTPNPSLTKIAWCVRHEPDIVAQTHKFLDAHAYLVFQLTGGYRSSWASADPMGLVDMRTHGWSPELVQQLGLHIEQFPELCQPGSVIGHVSRSASRTTALPAGLPVVAGAGDGQCAGLGVNATGGGRVSLNLGTAVVSGTMSADYSVDRSFRTLHAPIEGFYFLETVIQGGAFIVNWFVEQFGRACSDEHGTLSAEEVLEAKATQILPGSQGLMLVPYWNHAMTPYWDPAASGIIVGWTGIHSQAHVFRAILEGIAYEQRLVGGAMMKVLGAPFSEYIVLGGGSHSDLWCQILADVTQVPVTRSATAEATCLGAGILAAAAVGWYRDPVSAARAMTATGRRFSPDPANCALYSRLFNEVYEPLFPTLQPLIHRLTALSREAPT